MGYSCRIKFASAVSSVHLTSCLSTHLCLLWFWNRFYIPAKYFYTVYTHPYAHTHTPIRTHTLLLFCTVTVAVGACQELLQGSDWSVFCNLVNPKGFTCGFVRMIPCAVWLCEFPCWTGCLRRAFVADRGLTPPDPWLIPLAASPGPGPSRERWAWGEAPWG